MRTRSLSATAVRELWLSATITSGFTGKLRNAKHRSPTSRRFATAGPSSSGNTSTRSRSHATRERSNAPGPLAFRELARFLVGSLTNVRTHARSDEGLTCGEIRTFASNGWVAYLFDS